MRRLYKSPSLHQSCGARGAESTFTLLRSLRRNRIAGFLFLIALLLSSSVSLAGPPFLTDDPVPVDRGHWEINNYVAGSLANGASVGVAPGVDANYGAAQNLQLHLLVPAAVAQIDGMSTQWGLGDVEIGAKYRFLPAEEKDWWPQAAFYPFLDFPTGNTERGLGTGATHAFFPIWLQKDFGKWSTYGGGGYWVNPGVGNKNFWYAGWVVQYQLTDTLSLGARYFTRRVRPSRYLELSPSAAKIPQD
jgi:hypothetical protein